MLRGKKLIKLVDMVVKKHPEAFEAMLEFERTRKLPRPSYKERVNFTLNKNLIKDFRKYTKTKNQKMSNLLEDLIREKLKKQKPF